MKRFATSLSILAAILISVCMNPMSLVFGDEKGASDSVATVNGQVITQQDFDRELSIYKQRLQSQGRNVPPGDESKLRTDVLADLINRELVYQASQKKGVKVPAEEVDKVIADIKKRYPDEKAYQDILNRMQLTEERLRDQIIHQSAIRTLVDQEIAGNVKVSDDAALAFYQANPQYFQRPEQIHARHILIKVAADADEKTRTESRQKLEAIKKRIAQGEDFGELAKSESQGPSAGKGGDLGFFSKGQMVPPFEKAAFALKVNEVSDIVETNFGYHLIQLLERKEASTVKFEEAKDRIIANLRNEQIKSKVDDYIVELRKSADIKETLQ